LASSFEGVNLCDEALLQYDELEASFYQALKEKNLSWFGTLISPTAKDDSSPLLSITKKPYRDLILANTITVFDFRIYLLTRQCELLAQSGRITEVCRKTSAFLGAFGRRLREVEVRIFPCNTILYLTSCPRRIFPVSLYNLGYTLLLSV